MEKMSAISGEIEAVEKSLNVGYGNSRYKAVSEGDVLRAVKPIEQRHGVYSYPRSRRVIESGTMKTAKGNEQYYMLIETQYVFADIEKPDDEVVIVSYGMGCDSQDKAPGKAMTYCDKYALLKAYKIQTGDDPDAEASQEQAKITRKDSPIGERKAAALEARLKALNVNVEKLLQRYGARSLSELTEAQHLLICRQCEKKEWTPTGE